MAGQTTDVKIKICHFDDKKGRCRSLKVVQCNRNLPVIMPKYTTTSITKDISKTGRLTSKNAQPLSQIGLISVPHDD
jgi:hypothetical protein